MSDGDYYHAVQKLIQAVEEASKAREARHAAAKARNILAESQGRPRPASLLEDCRQAQAGSRGTFGRGDEVSCWTQNAMRR
jgi:hypothetical protein